MTCRRGSTLLSLDFVLRFARNSYEPVDRKKPSLVGRWAVEVRGGRGESSMGLTDPTSLAAICFREELALELNASFQAQRLVMSAGLAAASH
jgi:hypothetical protein